MAQCDQCRPPTFPLRTSFSGLDRLAISQLRCTFNEPITKTAAAPRWEIRLSPPRWLLRCIRRRKGRGRVDLDRDHGESDRPGMLVARPAVEQPTGYVLTQTCWRKYIRSSPWARPIQTAGQATRPGLPSSLLPFRCRGLSCPVRSRIPCLACLRRRWSESAAPWSTGGRCPGP
jgi:hypothetical protein